MSNGANIPKLPACISFFNQMKTLDTTGLFSQWYPRVKDCEIEIPDSVFLMVPPEICKFFFVYNCRAGGHMECILSWVKENVMPNIPDDFGETLFLRNGTFRNKTDFQHCLVKRDLYEIALTLLKMNSASIAYGSGGVTEVVIRKCIGFDEASIPCVYHGMPLRPEFRVFYDFDRKDFLYVVNLWDWSYCRKEISRSATDEIVYDYYYPVIQQFYQQNVAKVVDLVCSNLKSVTGLSGKWSIDIMYDMDTETFYLVDMGLAETSVGWEPEFASKLS